MTLTIGRALNLLRVLKTQQEISQRELAEQMDVSLGTANQTIRALVGSGILETNTVTTSKGKRGQTYHLTEAGQLQRKELAKQRVQEIKGQIQSLKKEIETCQSEID